MDAKPQRPLRNLRVYGDENAMPAVGASKTIHQRNKSSPALSTIHQAGGLKVAAKRTAFGDVSNVTNLARPYKDDSVIAVKGDLKFKENLPPIQLEKKTTTFQKPAQRPASVTGLRALLNHVTNPSNLPIVKQPLVEIHQTLQPSQSISQPTRRVASKKSNAIFNDAASVQPEKSTRDQHKPVDLNAPLASTRRELPPRPVSTTSQDVLEPQQNLKRLHSKYVDVPEIRKATSTHEATKQVSEEQAMRSDGICINKDGQLESYDYLDQVIYSDKVEIEDPAQDLPSGLPMGVRGSQLDQSLPELAQKQKRVPVSEPEEYWEEEDAVENYDEDGYVTARSFRSRGDNTTGGATTVLFPKVTQKVRKEIAVAKELIEGAKTVEELEDEAWDTTMVAEYGDEIFQYMRDLEIKMLPNAHYMDNQAEIQWSMRAVLMDWIVQVHHRFNLLPETLFLCVNYIDRFLSCKVVSLGKLQLVGATAIFIAAKYEEIDCPSVQEIVYMVDGGYTVDEILKAERFMLSMLQFELGWPGPMSFLRRISKADDYDLETRTLAKYFLEITIMDERFVGSPPSFVAAGAHCLARMMLRKGSWSPAHVYYSDYTYSQLYSLILLMVECCEDALTHHRAVYDKYTDKRYKRASSFAEGEVQKGFRILEVASNISTAYANSYDNQKLWGQTRA